MLTATEKRFDAICRANDLGEIATLHNTHQSTIDTCGAFELFFGELISNFERQIHKQSGRAINVHLCFCANATLNAFAVRDVGNEYFIGINTGTLSVLADAYITLFANTPFGRNFRVGDAGEAFTREQLLVNVAFFAAVQYILCHEVGHIAYGHADSVSEANAGMKPMLFEANTKQDVSLTAGLLQSMEIDADLYATSALVTSVAKGELCGLDATKFLQLPAEMFEVATIATLVMFHLFYGADVHISKYQMQSHPLPEIRFMRLCTRAWQLRSYVPRLSIAEDALTVLMGRVYANLPAEYREAVFPARRLEGSVNLQNKFKRIRANEDSYKQQLCAFAMLPVGAVII